ncbi:hypothetical protein B4U80_14533, partial [Leptotrombidium deliense]
ENSTCPLCRAESNTLVDHRNVEVITIFDEDEPRNEEADAEPSVLCGICGYVMCEADELAFVSNCMTRGTNHEFHLHCLKNEFIRNGSTCPTCNDYSTTIITSGGFELYFNQREKTFSSTSEASPGYIEDPPQCQLCDEFLLQSQELGRPVGCEYHLFHMECLALSYLENGPYCPTCGQLTSVIRMNDGVEVFFESRSRNFFISNGNSLTPVIPQQTINNYFGL